MDAYAGSGAVGIEALSRGAKHVFLIERNEQALAVIRDEFTFFRNRGRSNRCSRRCGNLAANS